MSHIQDDLRKEYNRILRQKRLGGIFSIILGILLLVSLLGALFLVTSIPDDSLFNNLWWNVPLFLGPIIPIVYFFKKQIKFIIENRELTFFIFYDLNLKIINLLDFIKNTGKDHSVFSKNGIQLYFKKLLAKRSFNILSNAIEGWTYYNSPIAFQEIPTSIVKNLKEKIRPIIDNLEISKMDIYSKGLQDDCNLLYKREPTLEEWNQLKDHLEKIEFIIEKEVKKEKGRKRRDVIRFLSRNFYKPQVNFFIIFGLSLFILICFDNNPGYSFVGSLVAAATVSAYINSLRKNKPTLSVG